MSCPIVSSANGKVSGSISKALHKDAKPVCVYRNIPFAKPPVDGLRFQPPQPADPWDGVRDGTVVGKAPVQSFAMEELMSKVFPLKDAESFEHAGYEDCLHLSVYTASPQKGKKLPVMVWLYGGGFQMGYEATYDGSVLAGLHEVVVVVPNYRVGVFGFLSLGPGSPCPGNAGLLDQKLALEWVRDNIDDFGGDKDNVTIFGESAGAISVHYQVISPLSRGLFHRAISHSGQATMPGLFNSKEKNEEMVASLLKKLKIEEKDPMKILGELQKAPADDLLKASFELSMKERLVANPSVDGHFLCKTPEQYLKDKDFAKVPYIIGCNNTEGHGLFGVFAGPNFSKGFTEQEARQNLFVAMNDESFEACKKFYMKDEEDDMRFSKLFGDLQAGAMFVVPVVETASVYAKAGAKIYVYLGAFQLQMYHDDEYGKELTKKMDWCICDHGDDISMMFGLPFGPQGLLHGAKFTDDEKKLSLQCMTYITNFAKYGDPNKGEKVPAKWPLYKPDGDHIIFAHPVSSGNKFSKAEVKLWTETIAEMHKKKTPWFPATINPFPTDD